MEIALCNDENKWPRICDHSKRQIFLLLLLKCTINTHITLILSPQASCTVWKPVHSKGQNAVSRTKWVLNLNSYDLISNIFLIVAAVNRDSFMPLPRNFVHLLISSHVSYLFIMGCLWVWHVNMEDMDIEHITQGNSPWANVLALKRCTAFK